MAIQYKRNEDKILAELKEYIDSTYSGHYAGKENRSVIDDWDDAGISKEAFMSNIMKYTKRFGKKAGENPKDIIKIIHYAIFLYNEVKYREGAEETHYDND